MSAELRKCATAKVDKLPAIEHSVTELGKLPQLKLRWEGGDLYLAPVRGENEMDSDQLALIINDNINGKQVATLLTCEQAWAISNFVDCEVCG